MNSIPPLDLTQQYRDIAPSVSAAVLDVLSSGQYINGPAVTDFAQQFGNYVGSPSTVMCNSGTDALYLALRALEIGPGDEVITSPFTFIATAETISAVGAVPVFVDISLDDFNLDVEQIEAAITPRTKAIMPVHLFGHPVDMTRVMAIAAEHNLPVIEDCAQATGAQWQGQQVGSIGQAGCFSFFPTKNLGACGDGGALTTADKNLAATAQMIAVHGSKVRYYHDAIGINSRLDTVQAAILSIKLQHLNHWNQQRQTVANRYHQLLSPIDLIRRPRNSINGVAVWNQYTLLIEAAPANSGDSRDRIRDHLRDQGIICMVYYPIPLHLQAVYADLPYRQGQFPKAEQAAHQVLSLPMFPELSADQQETVVYGLKNALADCL
ncbi:MAG: DegT/DnrJ/EryC1/StrS family aminotransferase [Cyanobacteria bacterium P01_D01_bin.128]